MSARAGPVADGVGNAGPASAHHHDGSCSHHDHRSAPFDDQALMSARGLRVERNGRVLLSDVDIDIRPREIVTLIGPNGAGKTTLVRTLLGLEALDGGAVRRAAGLRIGYVPQRFDVDRALPMTVARFLALGNGGRAPRIGEVLGEVGAARVVDQQLAELSGGELQRVVLARALLGDPTLLVLDEPVRGVDYVGEAELYTLIGRLRDSRGLGVLLVSHDLHVVMASSDRVLCLNRHVCCSGVPETVAQHPEYMRLFGTEAARAFGVYHHHHDHRHDLAGEPTQGVSPDPAGSAPAGASPPEDASRA
jgi:zinc transport system ATP-binding protein